MISSTKTSLDRSSTFSISFPWVERCKSWTRSFQIWRQQKHGIESARANLQRWIDRGSWRWLSPGVRQWNRWRANNPNITIDLRNIDLRGANLSGANLSGVNLSGANLDDAYLAGANLSGADLRNASLNRASLQGALIAEANLSGAILWWANLRGAIVSPDRLQGAHFNKDLGFQILTTADLSAFGADRNLADRARLLQVTEQPVHSRRATGLARAEFADLVALEA